MEKQKKSLIFLLIPVIIAILISLLFQSTVLKNQQIYTEWLLSFGHWFLLVYVIIQVIGIIIAPLGGFFVQVGLFALLPPIQALLLIYIVTTPAFFINYYVARRFGRPIITKLIGAHSMDRINSYVDEAGPATLLLFKIFQAGAFDYVSYAAGLTTLKPSIFFLINVFGGLPGLVISYLILTTFSNFTLAIVVLLALGYLMFGLSLILLRLKKNIMKQKTASQFVVKPTSERSTTDN